MPNSLINDLFRPLVRVLSEEIYIGMIHYAFANASYGLIKNDYKPSLTDLMNCDAKVSLDHANTY
jgi:hypothetical protein